MITSKNNPQVKRIHKLMGRAKSRREEARFVVEGIKMVTEAVHFGLAEEVYIAEGVDPGSDIFVTDVFSEGVMRDVSDTVTPQGVIAVVKMPEYERGEIFQRKVCRLLCLESVRDPGNIGTMIRTAEAAGIDAVVMSADCADIYQPKVVRSTMGSIFRVPCLSGKPAFPDELDELKALGFTLYAAHLKGSVDYREPAYGPKTALLIGNEANGLSEEVTERADVRIRIPMRGEVESLNAAVSAAILMYESVRENGG